MKRANSFIEKPTQEEHTVHKSHRTNVWGVAMYMRHTDASHGCSEHVNNNAMYSTVARQPQTSRLKNLPRKKQEGVVCSALYKSLMYTYKMNGP